jgi:hypothetical protein
LVPIIPASCYMSAYISHLRVVTLNTGQSHAKWKKRD